MLSPCVSVFWDSGLRQAQTSGGLGLHLFQPPVGALHAELSRERAAFNYMCSSIPLGCAPMRSCKLDKIIHCGPWGVLCLQQPGRPPGSPHLSKIVWLRQLQVHPSRDSLSGVLSLAGYPVHPSEEPSRSKRKIEFLVLFYFFSSPELTASKAQKCILDHSHYTAVGQRHLKCSLCALIAKMASMHLGKFSQD